PQWLSGALSVDLAHCFKAGSQIINQVQRVFEPDVDPNTLRNGLAMCADRVFWSRHYEAFVATPRQPKPEHLQSINESMERLLRNRVQRERKKPASAFEITFPERVLRVAG